MIDRFGYEDTGHDNSTGYTVGGVQLKFISGKTILWLLTRIQQMEMDAAVCILDGFGCRQTRP